MSKGKNLSNPSSSGGSGVHFEGHVQSSFVSLMLTGGHAPYLPCWPIVKIKLQGKIDGFDTDDLIVVVEDPNNMEQRKLLGQIKQSISITQGSVLFGAVIQAAWNDFNNPNVFNKDKDVIALITGPLTKTDAEVTWILNHAKANRNDPQRFFENVRTAYFSSNEKRNKLEVIIYHLKAANNGIGLSDEDIHKFLINFHLLGYDLGEEEGVVLSLINSHISQFKPEYPRHVWSRILEFTNNRNHHAGCITRDDLPDDLRTFFTKTLSEFPINLALPQAHRTDWAHYPDATYLAISVLIGAWQDKSQSDREVICQMLGISYDEWINKAREILHCPDSTLSLKNGIWRFVNRVEIWKILGSRIFDKDLNTFRSLAVLVLKEADPAFDLPPEDRYAANIYGKVPKYSLLLRKGIAEGLAILGTQPDVCSNCSQGKAEETSVLVIRELMTDADWVLWGSLNALLPILAESAPCEFLDAVEKAMQLKPCPFDELFLQEGKGITGANYLTGLLWALEGLAWEEKYLVRVCVALGELAGRDPGGQWANRPSNSLTTILLPWLPQTLASVDKRKVAVQTLLTEWPNIGWNMIIQLLPNRRQTSSGSHKPSWRKTIPDDWKKEVTRQEYQEQIHFYAELAVDAAGQDVDRLSVLIDHFDNLHESAVNKLLKTLDSQFVLELPEQQRLSIWESLMKFTNRHRKFSDSDWALPDQMILRIEQVAEKLAPGDLFNVYQHLFTDCDFDLYEEKGNWEGQQKKLETRREKAILEILQQNGIDGILEFAESVCSPGKVGHALGIIADTAIEKTFLPHLLDSSDNKRRALVSNYILRRCHINGWKWCDGIDKSDWTPRQVGQFLAYLPFATEAWDRASNWLKKDEREYWANTYVNTYQDDANFPIAIEKLIEHGRPHAAINCLGSMLHANQPIENNQCIRALLAALTSSEPSYTMEAYHIVELIKFLQSEPSVNHEDLFKIEWAYLPLLERSRGAAPRRLESGLASDPDFFCEVIQRVYRSNKEDQPLREPSEESKAIATNAWHLLHEWKTPPGTQKDGTFSEERFTEWLQRVKETCSESGHLQVALIIIGEILIHTPPDPNGLWINRIVAHALNDREADEMRRGFEVGTYNSRGAHEVDPTGKTERELAEEIKKKAEDIENAGFQRLAITLRSLSDGYNREAERM